MFDIAGGIILAGVLIFIAISLLAIFGSFVRDIFGGVAEIARDIAEGVRRFWTEVRRR